jgi:dienelactone hydrolase
MRRQRWIMLAAMAGMPAHAALPAPEHLSIASLDRDAAGAPVMVPALYFRPPLAPPDARIPLVIAVHGCGGLYSTRADWRDQLTERFAAWTAQLLEDGYAVLLPDSFTPRGLREICTIKNSVRMIGIPRRRLDVLGGLAHAAALPGVDPARIALVGWSNGGTTALAAIDVRDAQVAAFGARDQPFFRAAIAFYPGCAPSLRLVAGWETRIPTAIHIGELDDWTPAAPCVELATAVRTRGDPLVVTVHPASYHGFDAPRGRVVVRRDVPNGVHPGQGVTNGPNPAARRAAIDSVRALLRANLQPATSAVR